MSTQTARLIIALNEQVANRGLIKRAIDEIHAASNRPMGRGLVNLGRQMETEARRIKAAASSIAGSLAPAAFGVGALIAKTQEYEKALYGVKVSMFADNEEDIIENGTRRTVINIGKVETAAGKAKTEVEALSKALMMRPAALAKAWEAVGKAGVPYSLDGLSPQDREAKLLKSQRTLVEMGAEVHRQDTDMPIDRAAEFLHTLGINYKAGDAKFERGTGKGDYDADVAKLANQLLYVANATKTSASKLSAGLRQYAPLYGNLGNSFSESAALLGAMVQGGLDEIEAGTALKSMGVRFIKNFTSEGRDAWVGAGLKRSDFTRETAVSGKKAASQLAAMTDKKLTADQRKALLGYFLKAEKNGTLNEGGVMDAARFYNKLTGARDQATRDRNMDRVRAAMFSAGNEIDMFKLFRALSLKMGGMNEGDREKSLEAWGMGELGTMAQNEVKKRLEKGTLSQNQLSVIGEGRHLSRYNALLALFGTAEELERRARGLDDKRYTNAGRAAAENDPYWKWEQAMSRLEQAFNRLRESDAITGLINKLAELATKLAEADPKLVEFVGQMIALSFVLAPLSAALSGIVGSILIFSGALGMLKRLLVPAAVAGAAVPAGAAVAGGAGVAAAGGAGAVIAGGTAAAIARRQAILRRLRFGGMIGAGVIAGQAIGERVGIGGDGKAGTEVGGMVAGGAAGYGLYRYLNWRTARKAAGGARFVPGLGWILTGGAAAYGAYEGYKKDSTLGGAAKGAFHGLTFGLFDTPSAQGAPSPASTITSAGNQVVAGGAAGVQAGAPHIAPVVGQTMAQARSIVQQAASEMTALGEQMMANLASGIRAGAPAVGAAVQDAMSSQVRGAVRGSFTDGGYR